jgi:transposase-like protein
MEDYPRTIQEFERRFSREENCRAYLVSLRWPDGFRCPQCKGTKAVVVRHTLYQCCGCRHQTSVTAGTIFQDTRKPLVMWFRTMWYVTSQKNGASALGLQRVLGLASYETAWTWLHKLRRAMVRPDRDRLSGWVEVDETLVGGEEEGVSGRQTARKVWVVIAAQADGPGIGRIRMRVVEDCSADNLHTFLEDCIEPGSVIHTDGWQGYAGLEKKGYQREITKLGNRRKEAAKLMPRVHRIASLVKRWLLGTHQGAVAYYYLPYYLDEFTFRFNRRKSRSRGKLFYRLMQQALNTSPRSYESMVKPFREKLLNETPQDVGLAE